MTRNSINMELEKLKDLEDLPAIDMADIQNSCFAQTINSFLGLLTQHVSDRVGQDKLNVFDFFDVNESYIYELYLNYQALEFCLESIDLGMKFISDYSKRDYIRPDFVPFDKYAVYHCDVIYHKISTIHDVLLKLINAVYNLGLQNNNCKYKEIEKHKTDIDNDMLFELIDAFYKLTKKINDRRNSSSHDGKLKIPALNDIRSYLMLCEVKEKFPLIYSQDKNYERNSLQYYSQIYNSKDKIMKELSVHRYNVFCITRCMLCTMYDKLLYTISTRCPIVYKDYEEQINKERNNCAKPCTKTKL